ncbi:response regulator [Sphingomonas sp.]|uniref:response regulator n=1 Tax=Sphingomonas sp. TaxID=28214 RepID=UPI003B3AF469
MNFLNPADLVTHDKGARILVADRDADVRRNLTSLLAEHHFDVLTVKTHDRLMQVLAVREPDLLVLDLQIDADKGLELLREVRSRSAIPVIATTGDVDEEVDIVAGLELGADDYLLKPIDHRELLARIRSALRRRAMDRLNPAKQRGMIFRFAGWSFTPRERLLTSPDDNRVSLTKGEFALLSAFVQAPRVILSRERLLQATRLHEDVFDRSVDVQVLRLRRKIEEEPRAPRLILTERGVGYKLDAEVEII